MTEQLKVAGKAITNTLAKQESFIREKSWAWLEMIVTGLIAIHIYELSKAAGLFKIEAKAAKDIVEDLMD